MTPRSTFLHILHHRDLIHQCTDLEGLDAHFLAAEKSGQHVTAYIGFDPTADSLHVGSLATIMLLRRLQQAGHRPIVLLGGGTSKIGDPSGKDESRQLLTDTAINANIAGIRQCFGPFIDFGGTHPALLRNNADWLDGLGYIQVLREIGTAFTVNRMLTLESVRTRLEREQPLTFLEFNYSILQAYDFLHLYRHDACTLQLGGSDQWGNIVGGMELVRRLAGGAAFGLTTPLITTADGRKMGKSVNGAIWLRADRLGPFDYWQYWRNTADADVGRMLRVFTELPLDEITRLEKLAGQEINEAKIILATAATTLCHGRSAAEDAAARARALFVAGDSNAAASFAVPRARTAEGYRLKHALVDTGHAPSLGEAKRLITNGGVRVNGRVVTETEAIVDFTIDQAHIQVGKKHQFVLQLSD